MIKTVGIFQYPKNIFFYHGKEEMLYDSSDSFQEIVIKSIDDLLPFTTTDISYSYRGQSNSEWGLKTTFERFLEERKVTIDKFRIEEKILKKYQSQASIFSHQLGYDPLSQDALDALADIQHHGGPTRLLDFTSSFNVYLFFATFNNFKTNSAVYCLRQVILNEANFDMRKVIMRQPSEPGVLESLPPSKDENKLLHFHVPKRKNERLQRQDGHFICSGSARHSFEESLSYTFGLPIIFTKQASPNINDVILRSTLIKVIIPKELSGEVQRFLKRSSITASTLFPDYHGAIQSLYEIETDRI